MSVKAYEMLYNSAKKLWDFAEKTGHKPENCAAPPGACFYCVAREAIQEADKDERSKTVTEFIENYCLRNGDNFYTPFYHRFETHEEAVKAYNGSWNQNRGENGEDDPQEAPHPEMRAYAELPYGRICQHCGGSMVAIIQMDEHGNVLKTLLLDCG